MRNIVLIMVTGLLVVGIANFTDGWMDYKAAKSLSNSADRAVKSACLTGFTEARLTDIASRENMTNLQERTIMLNKSAAASKTAENLQANLMLDSAFVPMETSKIKSSQALNVVIRVINEDETPVVINGQTVRSTTIYVSFDIPITINGREAVIPKEYFWSSDTFLANGQI